MPKQPCIYILASNKNGTLYIGVTSDLSKRVWEHKQDVHPGFTRRYQVHRLVCVEQAPDMLSAIAREKQLKIWNRQWKIGLSEAANPHWQDLSHPPLGATDHLLD